jgi:hypothetical protein
MDFLTQQLIATANRLLNALHELRDCIDNLAKKLQEQSRAQHDASETAQQAQHAPPILSAELKITHPIEVKTERKVYEKVVSTFTLAFVAAYTIITIFIFCESKRSADAATNAADTTARQLELTQRPWVFVNDATVVSPLTFDKDGAHVTFEITIHNSGLTPAANALIVPRLYPLQLIESPKLPIERLCDATSYISSSTGLLIFPNTDSPPQALTLVMSKKEIEDNTHSGGLDITPFICVLYRPTFRKDGPGYPSGIRYSLSPTIWPDKTTSIPANQLSLIRNGFLAKKHTSPVTANPTIGTAPNP